jgi:hypothetical protein
MRTAWENGAHSAPYRNNRGDLRVLQPMIRHLMGLACLGCLVLPALAQEKAKAKDEKKADLKKAEDLYRQFFKPPETAIEYWAAMQYEIAVGKYDLAAEDLKGFLAKNPGKEDLLAIEEQEGMSAFLRLLNIPQLRPDAQKLLDRVTQVVKENRADPERIQRFIKNLQASPEEREYAIIQLRKSGAVAVPYMVEALRNATDRTERSSLVSALVDLGRPAITPVLAALDAEDAALKLELIEVVRRLADPSAAAGLWYPSVSPREPETVRTQATATLVLLLGVERPEQLPPATKALVGEAERYYQHRVPFAKTQPVTAWAWQNNRLVGQALTASQAEEFYGLRYAGQALALDPAYEPAQIVYLSLALEKGVERSGLDQPLEKNAPQAKQLARVVNPALLVATLDRALADHRVPVILGVVRTLGDLGVVQALRPSQGPEPALLRALDYPDRRVQLAAADAVLRIPNTNPYPISVRVVEVLRRAGAADAQPRVLVAAAAKDLGEELARALQAAGFATEVKSTGVEVLKRLREAADIDALVIRVNAGQRFLPTNPPIPGRPQVTPQVVAPRDPIRYALPDPGLPDVLAQIRADRNIAYVPVLLMVGPDQTGKVPPEFEAGLHRLIEHYRNVWTIPNTTDKDSLRRILTLRITEANGAPLTEAERKANAVEAMHWLDRLAQGEVPGYDVRPAAGTILKGLRNPDLAIFAIEAASRLPGPEPQRELARVVLSDAPPAIRAAAATALARDVQAHGIALTNEIAALQDLYAKTDDAKLKGNLALVLGSLRPDARQTGERLLWFRPVFTPPAKEPAKEKEK